jgi:D-glycero-alpha-D-manno-heptose-7-phosphate kinase
MSFVGGGSDLKEYYKHTPGSVISTTIDKYVYTCVNERFTNHIRVGYSKVEMVDSIDKVEHNIVREALKAVGIDNKIEIMFMSDLLPKQEGSGLGASSAIAVGSLHALSAHKGIHMTPEQLAQGACNIEIEKMGCPIGKQDQYIAAYGGFNQITFYPDETVVVNPITLSNNTRNNLNNNLLMFFTGISTRSDTILTEQKANTHTKLEVLDKMVYLTEDLRDSLCDGDLSRFGTLLHTNWLLKRQLSSNISNPIIDSYYDKAMNAGALGGKILGSGGGGFFLFYCEPEHKQSVKNVLCDLKEVKFGFEPHGSRILFS